MKTSTILGGAERMDSHWPGLVALILVLGLVARGYGAGAFILPLPQGRLWPEPP